MLDQILSVPGRALQALDDLHSLTVSLDRLSADRGQIETLTAAAEALPKVEDELSANVALLREDVANLREQVIPLHTEAVDLDDTAEKLESALAQLQTQVVHLSGSVEGFRGDLNALRDKIPGL